MNTMSNEPNSEEHEPARGLAGLFQRLGQAELGPIPIIIGLILIWIIFQIANNHFLSPLNLTNLMYQMADLGVISVGAVLVLLLGEVDLSAGAVSGLAGGVVAVISVNMRASGPLSVLLGLLTGAAVGLLQGFWITRFKIPSFIITLAGQIAWTGALLYVLGDTGTINLRDKFVVGLAGTFLKRDVPHGVLIGWLVGAVFVIYFAASRIWERRRRRAAGLVFRSVAAILIQVAVMAIVVAAVLVVTNLDRGLPSAMIFLIVFVIFFDFLTQRTKFGRHIYAVGGNPEAARRASVNVTGVRIGVFVIASTLAAFGGILAASRLLAANQDLRQRRPSAARHRLRRHWGYQPVRRARQCLVSLVGRICYPIHFERNGPAFSAICDQIHDHRCSTGSRSDHRGHFPTAARDGRSLTAFP